ncbi:MAG: SWF/SNF helicase family protein, partial [Chloroflexi bacterium]
LGEAKFNAQYQCPVRSLTAFEKSDHPDDWREMMRHYLVRRTRSFIQTNYALYDQESCRSYLEFHDGTHSYFPLRVPRTVKFALGEEGQDDPYALLYSEEAVKTISDLCLPRYGMASYIATKVKATETEKLLLHGLSRGGKRLMGFCRTNLFKRLESGGSAFLQSITRHILRNHVFLYAIENGFDLPIGTQSAELLDTQSNDEDDEIVLPGTLDEDDASTEGMTIIDETRTSSERISVYSEGYFKKQAAAVYEQYSTQFRKRFKWIKPTLFNVSLKKDLRQDTQKLQYLLKQGGLWQAQHDHKLNALINLLTQRHPNEKVLIFTQFADTVRYLTEQLKAYGIAAIEGVTGTSENPTEYAWRFSPLSNNQLNQITPERELRVLVATDVLSEGQNLQDAAIVVNYDLPWAIIRLIQRAGRIDRIGQRSDSIYCYSFLPAEGVEKLIRLRERVRTRLRENAEVVGTDEAFFEDDEMDNQAIIDLYNEKAGILDGDADSEIDLASQAYQIWKNATDADPRLKHTIEQLPNVVFSTRAHQGTALAPEGILVYMRTPEGNDSLAWINRQGESVTQSQLAILRAAACDALTPTLQRPLEQHDLVRRGVEHIIEQETHGAVGQLGSRSGARLRTYQRLIHFVEASKNSLFPAPPALHKAIDEIYRYPLQESARDTLNRQLRAGINDDDLANLVIALRDASRLCHVREESDEVQEPQIICSLGLFTPGV